MNKADWKRTIHKSAIARLTLREQLSRDSDTIAESLPQLKDVLLEIAEEEPLSVRIWYQHIVDIFANYITHANADTMVATEVLADMLVEMKEKLPEFTTDYDGPRIDDITYYAPSDVKQQADELLTRVVFAGVKIRFGNGHRIPKEVLTYNDLYH